MLTTALVKLRCFPFDLSLSNPGNRTQNRVALRGDLNKIAHQRVMRKGYPHIIPANTSAFEIVGGRIVRQKQAARVFNRRRNVNPWGAGKRLLHGMVLRFYHHARPLPHCPSTLHSASLYTNFTLNILEAFARLTIAFRVIARKTGSAAGFSCRQSSRIGAVRHRGVCIVAITIQCTHRALAYFSNHAPTYFRPH